MITTAHWRNICYAAMVSTGLSLAALQGTFAQDVPPPPLASEPAMPGEETLTRGPIHEAFASPTTFDPQPGIVVPNQPPQYIDEVPPEYQPEGDDIIWIPGYPAWDEELGDFIWVSGVWRERPPGQRWVPGYWNEVTGGYQWIPGFWIDETATELSYQPAPPESLEVGPSSPQPGDDQFWIPGNWVYVNNNYNWTPGYWAPYQPNWIWTPACYYYTPRGYVYSAGFHDYRFSRRGQMFAPVYFQNTVYRQPGFVYTPRIAINAGNLFVNLWVRPNYGHYYYGNFYGQQYANWNLTPWYKYGNARRQYDPLWAYSNVHYGRQGINYTQRMQGWHNYYVQHENARPPRTYSEQIRFAQRNDASTRINQNIIGVDLRQLVNSRDERATRFHKLDDRDRQTYTSFSREIKDLHRNRLQVEHGGAGLNDRKIADGAKGDSRNDRSKGGKTAGDFRDRTPPGGSPTTGLALPKMKLPKPVAINTERSRDIDDADPRKVPPRPDSREIRERAIAEAAKARGTPGTPNKPFDGTARNDESGPTLDQRIKEARERAAAQAGNNPGTPKKPFDGTARNDESGPTLDQRIKEARERAAAQAGNTPGTPKKPFDGTARNDESGPTLDRRIQEARERAAAEAAKARERAGLPGNTSDPRSGVRGNSRVPRVDVQELPDNAPDFPGANLPGQRNPTPRIDPRNTDPRNVPRVDPRNVPRTETKRVEIPKITTPQPAPRIEIPRNTPKVQTPKVEAPRSAPRVESPRIQPPRNTPKVEVPRVSTPRPQPAPRGNSGGKGGGNRNDKEPK